MYLDDMLHKTNDESRYKVAQLAAATGRSMLTGYRPGRVKGEVRAPKHSLQTYPWQPAFHEAALREDALYLIRPDTYVAVADSPQKPRP